MKWKELKWAACKQEQPEAWKLWVWEKCFLGLSD